jgi:hypothetical protein
MARQDNEPQPFTEQDLYKDPWSAVYRPISADADQTLLELAHIAVSRCQASVAGGEPELVNRLFTPTDLGREATPEQNCERATARLAELNTRLEAVREASPPFDQERKTFRPTTNPEPGRYDALKQPTPEQRIEPMLPPERSMGALASALFGAGEKLVSGIFESLADMISPSPPLTFEQAEGLARAEGARAEQAWAAQYARHAEAADDYRRELAEQSQVGDGNVPEETLTPEERQSHSRGRGR